MKKKYKTKLTKICIIPPERPTIRKVIYKNRTKLRHRYFILSHYLKKKQLSWKTDFWWAKVQRKLTLLKMLCNKFEKQEDCPCRACTDKQSIKDRVEQIKTLVSFIEESLNQYKPIFNEVPVNYGYALKSPYEAERVKKIKLERILREDKLLKQFKKATFILANMGNI